MSSTVELAATCNALGYLDPVTKKYYADENTLETVKDLIRYLRRDDDTHEIRRYLGDSKIVLTDLLPLLNSYWEQTELFDLLLRLLVNLTTPAISLWGDVLPEDKINRHYYMQIDNQLIPYKAGFADDAIWSRLSMRLSKIFEVDYGERGDANSLIIERILVLIRNVLLIDNDTNNEFKSDNEANTHDTVLWSLHQSGMLDILLYIVSSPHEQAYHLHCLEIFCHMLGEMNPTVLAQASQQRSQAEKMQEQAELLAISHREQIAKQEKLKKFLGTRHSNFGGTYVVQNMKSIGDNDLIYHKPLSNIADLNFDIGKRKPKTPKNRAPVRFEKTERRSTISVRLFLKEFCIDFLNGAYNNVMHHVKDSLSRGRHQDEDETYYLWTMKFFMEFNRNYKAEVKLVSETMSVQTFHYVQQQMEHHFDMLSTDKKKCRLWAERLHKALLAYRELLLTLISMDKSADEGVRKCSTVIKSNVFYVLEYREFILILLLTFDEVKMSNLYLNDLLETQHIFLKMFESYCGKDNKIFQTTKKIRKKKSNKVNSAENAAEDEMDLESQWDDVAPQLSAILETGSAANIPTDVLPYDSTLETPVEEQRPMAMLKIQHLFRDHEFEKGIAYLRAAREVWPENDAFGTVHMAPEEEFLAIKDIFFAELQDDSRPTKSHPVQSTVPDNEEDDEEEDDDDMPDMDITETNFKFDDFVKRFCHPKIVRACSLSLAFFERNSVFTNHCIAKLLHRIAFTCKMSTMMFQLSIFRIFQRIYEKKAYPEYKELCKFATYIIQQFLKKSRENSKVYMEALFWKSIKDACDIDDGYEGNNQRSAAAAKAWTELEEDELRRLYMEHQENQIEEDVVDWLLKNLIDHMRTRRGVLKKLKDMYLLTNYKPRKSGPSTSGRNQKQWTEDEENQLRELFEQFRDAMDPLFCIMERLDVGRPKNRIIEKLLVMGIIQDRKEVRKKRSKKSQDGHNSRSDPQRSRTVGLDSDLDTCSSSDDDERPSSNRPSSKKQNKTNKKIFRPTMQLPTSFETFKLLTEAIEQGMSEALEWLKESLTEAADDIDVDVNEEEGIPLVPLMESATTAMESSVFQNLLRAVGVKEPADEQETYWRISGQLSLQQLRSVCQNITDALEGRSPNPDSEMPSCSNVGDVSAPVISSDDEDVFDRIRKSMQKPDEEVESVTATHGQGTSSKSVKRKKKTSSSSPKSSQNTRRSSNNFTSSSSDEDDVQSQFQKSSGSVRKKPRRIVDNTSLSSVSIAGGQKSTDNSTASDSSDSETGNKASQSTSRGTPKNKLDDSLNTMSPRGSQSTVKSSQTTASQRSTQRSSHLHSSSDEEAENAETPQSAKAANKKIVDSDGDSDKENDVTLVISPDSNKENDETFANKVSSQATKTSHRKKRITFLDDDSDDSEPEIVGDKSAEISAGAPAFNESADSKRARILDSDSDEESKETGHQVKKTKMVRAVQSDEDSE